MNRLAGRGISAQLNLYNIYLITARWRRVVEYVNEGTNDHTFILASYKVLLGTKFPMPTVLIYVACVSHPVKLRRNDMVNSCEEKWTTAQNWPRPEAAAPSFNSVNIKTVPTL